MNVLYGPGIKIATLNGLHDFLTARGWELGPYSHLGDSGYPEDPDTSWDYPHSYGGTVMHTITEITPATLGCTFSFEDGLSIVVDAAGNIRGCPEHADAEHRIPVTDDDLQLDTVAALLDDLEPRARELNPRELIECRFFGPCGEDTEHLG